MRHPQNFIDCGEFGIRVMGKYGMQIRNALREPVGGEVVAEGNVPAFGRCVTKAIVSARLSAHLRVRTQEGTVYIVRKQALDEVK